MNRRAEIDVLLDKDWKRLPSVGKYVIDPQPFVT